LESQTSANPFLNIPRKKLDDALKDIKDHYSDKNGILTREGAILTEVFYGYYQANIPVDYWWRDMTDFIGPQSLKVFYESYISDINRAYKEGKRARFGGKHGIGKTLTCACILKRVVETQKYSALYVNLTDVIHVLLTASPEEKIWARKMLLETDFLVIDELDDRFMGTENAADLFGRILEPIMRTRIQNRMPLFFCTNTSKVEDSFSGPLKASIESLMNLVKLVPIIGGDDARAMIKRGEL
jgi:DNA replication protein DnaC